MLIYIYFSLSLSGWAMVQYLPTGEFRFIPKDEWSLDDILGTPADADHGYYIECDLSYPTDLHDTFNDYPPAPIKKSPESLSPYQTSMIRENIIKIKPDIDTDKLEEAIKKSKTSEKLIADLTPKKNYICHYRLLQKFVQLGMKIDKIHRVVKYKQAPWMKEYIDYNTQRRTEATTEFEKDFYKLMNNR